MDRRIFTRATIALAGAWPVARALAWQDKAQENWGTAIAARCREIEVSVHGRLGVAVLDTGSGTLSGHRLDERFPMCSTFKVLVVALVLSLVDAGKERLERRVTIAPGELLEWAPVTRLHAGSDMTLAALCEAAITVSDNTAANLLLAASGGAPAVTAFARRLGDTATRLDRIEPALNESRPGDPRDTTTPRAMARTLRTLMLGDALSASGRARLAQWMSASTTGAKRLRAGVPPDWRVADKTGTGRHGGTNDVGLLWPPRGVPLVVTAYLTQCEAPADAREEALARVARSLPGSGWTPAT